MTVAFRAALAGNSAATAATTQAVTLPTGWAAGDFCLIGGVQDVATTPTFTTPSGWTLVDSGNPAGTYAYAWYWRVLQAGDASPVLTSTLSGTWDWNSAGVYSATGGTLAFDAAAATVNVTTPGNAITPGAATASQAGDASLIAIGGRASSATTTITSVTNTPPSGWTNGTPTGQDWFPNTSSTSQRMSATMYQLGLPPGSIAPGSDSFTTSGTGSAVFRFSATQVLVSETGPPPAPARVTAGRVARLAETYRLSA